MNSARLAVLCCVGVGLLGVGCVGSAGKSTRAQERYGASVDVTNAFPAPAVAAEESLYVGRTLALDGRITGIRANGCTLRLDAGEAPPLIVSAARTADGSCAWQVPADAEGFAVATGALRVADDTLRLAANGVQVTPVQYSNTTAQRGPRSQNSPETVP